MVGCQGFHHLIPSDSAAQDLIGADASPERPMPTTRCSYCTRSC